MTETSTAPTDDDLTALADDKTEFYLYGFRDIFAASHANPAAWPQLAAKLQLLASELDSHGAELAAALAAYGEANPILTRPDDGPAVLLIPPAQHQEFSDYADELVDDTTAGKTWIEDYGIALFAAHGRAELGHLALPLGETEGVVMVLLHLVDDPAAIVQIHVGGINIDHQAERDVLEATLADMGVTTGRPRFWPPVPEVDKFLIFDDDVFDAYGRRVADSVAVTPGE